MFTLFNPFCFVHFINLLVADNGALSPNVGNEKLSVRRMVSLIRQIGGDSDGEGVDVQHRRIQRMLEETLTKNMHLQVCHHFNVILLCKEIIKIFFTISSTGGYRAIISGSCPLKSNCRID